MPVDKLKKPETWWSATPTLLPVVLIVLGVPAVSLWVHWQRFQDCRAAGRWLAYCVVSAVF